MSTQNCCDPIGDTCCEKCPPICEHPQEVRDTKCSCQKCHQHFSDFNPKHAIIGECCLYQEDCKVCLEDCRASDELCTNDYRHQLNNRFACSDQAFNRWRSIYEMTTDYTGQQLLKRGADCRRKPFLPRRCKLCNISDDIYLTEQLCKEFVKTKCDDIVCNGDYECDPSSPRHPPPMIMTDPRHCFQHPSVDCFNPLKAQKIQGKSQLALKYCDSKKKSMPPSRFCYIRSGDAPDLSHLCK